MVLAANPLHMLNLRQRGMESAALTVDERNPDYRIILNPILDDGGHVVGLAGMILDEDYLRKKLLPSIITTTLAKYLPSAPDGELAVTVTNGAGNTVVRVGDGEGRGVAAKSRLGFVFTDWEMALYNPRATPHQWARAGFVFNVSLAGLLALALIGGVSLALRAADRAVKLSQMKSDFVSNVSHELRTPLASIRVFGELLRLGRVQSPEKVREYGEYIETESRRLTQLIDNILDFSRIESGRKELPLRAGADLGEVVDARSRTFEVRLAAASGFRIALESPGGARSRRLRIDARRDRPGAPATCSTTRSSTRATSQGDRRDALAREDGDVGDRRARSRHRHPARRAAEDLRALPPRGDGSRARREGERPRPVDRAPHRRGARRRASPSRASPARGSTFTMRARRPRPRDA